jgi:hypothetical protein
MFAGRSAGNHPDPLGGKKFGSQWAD